MGHYTLLQAQSDIGDLRGLIAHLAGSLRWETITTFLNSWTAGGTGPCRVAFVPGTGMAYLEVNLVPGTLADSTHICTLPSAIQSYAPATDNRNIPAGTRGGTASTNGPFLQVLTGGDVQCLSMPTGTTSVRVGAMYPLD